MPGAVLVGDMDDADDRTERTAAALADALALGDRACVAFVGAGGKKTAMAHLVRAGSERGLGVGYTTTTHTPPPEEVPLVVADGDRLPSALAGHERPLAFAAGRVANPRRADEKVRGYASGVIDRVGANVMGLRVGQRVSCRSSPAWTWIPAPARPCSTATRHPRLCCRTCRACLILLPI